MQCQSCKAEWNLSNSTSKQKITVCPFCGANLLTGVPKESNDISIKDIVHSLVLQQGKELYSTKNEMRFKGLLSDLGNTYLKEQKILKVAVSERIPAIMLENDDKNDDEKNRILLNCKNKLVEDVGLMENRVVEALNTLAYGLDWNIKIETNSKKKNNSTKTIKEKTLVNNTNNSTTEHSEDSNENAKSIDYKNAFINGKHFVYITDSSELLCPNCHMSADPDATLCYNCNTSFVLYSNSNSQTENNTSKQSDYALVEKDLKTFAIVRNGNPNNYYCPNCHLQVNPSSDICPNCNISFYRYNTNKLSTSNSSKKRKFETLSYEAQILIVTGSILGAVAFIGFIACLF